MELGSKLGGEIRREKSAKVPFKSSVDFRTLSAAGCSKAERRIAHLHALVHELHWGCLVNKRLAAFDDDGEKERGHHHGRGAACTWVLHKNKKDGEIKHGTMRSGLGTDGGTPDEPESCGDGAEESKHGDRLRGHVDREIHLQHAREGETRNECGHVGRVAQLFALLLQDVGHKAEM